MNGIAKLTCGPRTLSISGRYSLPPGLNAPPGSREIPNISFNQGASLGELVGKSGAMQSISWMVQIGGNSEAEVRRGEDDLAAFLQQAGDPDEPLIYHWKADDTLDFEPLWGTLGAARRIEIVSVDSRERWSNYMVAGVREKVTRLTINMQIQPYFKGRPFQFARANNGIELDRLGMADGRSRGILVLPARTNYITNPFFMHPTNWENDWSSLGAVSSYLNKDREFILFGETSSRIYNDGAAKDSYIISVIAPNTNTYTLAIYVKKPDASAVTFIDASLYYGGAVAAIDTHYNDLGNGWYRVWAAVTGVAAPTNAGIELAGSSMLYIGGGSFQNESIPSYPAVGHLPGCVWSGTEHDSTSTRTGGSLRHSFNDYLNVGGGTILMAFQAWADASECPDMYLWDAVQGLAAYFDAATDAFIFTDGANTVTSAAQTFAAGDYLLLGFSWSADGLAIYMAGLPIADVALYAANDQHLAFFIGSDQASADQLIGTIMGFIYYDRAITEVQHQAVYANHGPVLESGRRLDWLPCYWIRTTNSAIDNCLDATPRKNFAIFMDVPGDLPPDVLLYGRLGSSKTFADVGSVWFSVLHAERVYRMADIAFHDQSGTVDAACSGGQKLTTSVDATATIIGASVTVTREEGSFELLGKEFVMLTRLTDAGSELTIAPYFGIGNAVIGEYQPIDPDSATMYLFQCGPLFLPNRGRLLADQKVDDASIIFRLYGKRTSGAAANVAVDYYALFPAPWARIAKNPNTAATGFVYDSRLHRALGTTAAVSAGYLANITDIELPVDGHGLTFKPDKYNILSMLIGDIDKDPVITYTLAISASLTPKWSLA